MALPATLVWEARGTGNINNGGGFVAGGAGTDYSQQDSPALSLTDLATTGVVTTLTSATGGFTALMVDNLIQITSGTNFTPAFYRITGFTDSHTVTLDRAPATGAGSAGVGRVGGALAAITHPAPVAGNTIWVQGSFGFTGTLSVAPAGTMLLPITYNGYGSTRGDNGLATMTATAAWGGTQVLSVGGTATVYRNFKLDAASLASAGLIVQGGLLVENCWGLNATGAGKSGISVTGTSVTLRRCKGSNSGASGLDAGITVNGTAVNLIACSATGNGGNGFTISGAQCLMTECIAAGNTLSGFCYSTAGTASVTLLGNTSVGNTQDGLRFVTLIGPVGQGVQNNTFANNTGWGINSNNTNYTGAGSLSRLFRNNSFYNNTAGSYNQIPAGSGDVIVTLDPFTNYAGGDYSLNNSSLAGANLRGAGDSSGIGLFDGLAETTASAPDIGASQAGAATGTGGIGDPASLRTLWRELTNERSLAVVPDSTIDLYLNGGLQSLNRRVHYHLTDTSTAITLVAGQQEYALPSDALFVAWIQWNGKEIAKADTDEWRRRDIDWRNAKPGAPQEWAHYKDRLILYPTPDAAAVAAQPNLLFRYVSTPPDFSTNGAEQLTLQDRRIPVYWAVAEWASAHPDSALATIRAEAFQTRFAEEAELIKADYVARMVGR